MTEIPSDTGDGRSPSSIEFWIEEAATLKRTADLSWQADLNVMQQTKLMYSPQHDRLLRHATEELGVELNLLYRYLISLAIQYLAIGMLIHRDPFYFVEQRPGNRIVALLDACGMKTSPQQRELLQETENAYEWAARYPFGETGGSHDELRELAHTLSEVACLSLEEKQTLESLYQQLQNRAAAAATVT